MQVCYKDITFRVTRYSGIDEGESIHKRILVITGINY
jgi:hypothetical protein